MSLVLVGSGHCFDHMMEKLVKETARHVLEGQCWGEGNQQKYDIAVWGAIEKCLQLAPSAELEALTSPDYKNALFPNVVKNPFKQFQEYQDIDQLVSLWRNKRDTTGLLEPDQDDFLEFIDDFRDFKGSMATKIGNLTCVLMEMNLITSDFRINIDEYTKDMSEEEDFDVTESALLQDPEWLARLEAGYLDCYEISESIPSAALDDNPLTKMFGRQMIFFKCAAKNEKINCALGAMKKLVETWYGEVTNTTEYGLPEDTYEAAGLTLMVMENSASDEEKFVSNFFWGAMH